MSKKKKPVKKTALKPFDAYAHYVRAVQSPEPDCEFVSDTFKKLRGRRPRFLREDFCGTFALMCEWVRRHPENRALGVDVDLKPIDYGRTHFLPKLSPAQQKRIQLQLSSVLDAPKQKVDVTLAMNFSYCLFKKRAELLLYFKQVLSGLKRDGMFILDAFGGPASMEANEEKTKIGSFFYYWDQTNFNPITNEALFYIHFKRRGEKKRERIFTYDWRLWSLPELRDILHDAGFAKSYVYWEGTTRSGNGDGNFKQTEKGDEADGWIAYVVALK